MSQWLGKVWKTLLSCEWISPDMGPSKIVLPNTRRRIGQNQQRKRKWVRREPGPTASAIVTTGLDQPQMGLERQKVPVEWPLRSSLHKLGSKWTKWKGQWTVWTHLDWAPRLLGPGNRVLERPPLWQRQKLPLWACVQEASLGERSFTHDQSRNTCSAN